MSRTCADTSRFDADRAAVCSSPAARLPRGDGAAELVFGREHGRTVPVHLYQQAPCRVLFPKTHRGELPTGVLLTTSGGLAGGDRIRVELATRLGARALVTSQAAEKIYRSAGDACVVETTIRAGPRSWLEWMPQETILFDQSRLRRSTTIEIRPGAEVLAGELIVFGRLARGEMFRNGSFWDRWAVFREGRPVWLDTLVMDGSPGRTLEHPAGFDGAKGSAVLVHVSDHAGARLAVARALLERCTVRCGATCIHGVLIVRFLAVDAHALRCEYARFWAAFRAAVQGLPEKIPRVWEC